MSSVKIDAERTKQQLAIDPDKLPDDSHEKVVVFCTLCGEQFLRERRNVHLPHNCPRWGKIDGKYVKRKLPEYLVPQDLDTPVRLECRLIHRDAKLPHRKRTTDVGHDLYSVEEATIPAHCVVGVKTGLQLSAPEGFYYTIEGRSGLFLKGITPFRGIIDATYCGEVVVVLMNASNEDYKVEVGDRIGQIILHKAYNFDITVVNEFSPDYDLRGEAGWGSSGQ